MRSTNKVDCFQSTVKNTSGHARRYTFLPPHGRLLAANEEVVIDGDLLTQVVRKGDAHSDREIRALMNSVDQGNILVKQLPRPIIKDDLSGNPRQLRVRGTAVTAEHPCWESEVAEDF